MIAPDFSDVSGILAEMGRRGTDQADVSSRLFEAVYQELRRVASNLMKGERVDHTLQPTALVNEAYIRLAGSEGGVWQNRAHFMGAAARAMRRILVEHARARATGKRGGSWDRVSFSQALDAPGVTDADVVDLDRVLTRFADLDPRAAQVVEYRVFAGMEVKEIALLLGVAERTVYNDWRVARMWLGRELAGVFPE